MPTSRLVSEHGQPLRPAFVVGAERSGSTLLRLILDQHPQLSFPHQLEFAVDWVGDDGSFPMLDAYLEHLPKDGVFRRSGFRIAGSGYGSYQEIVDSFLTQPRRQAVVVGGTVHRNFHRLPHVWPEARYIHLLRDPRAVARSCVSMGWYGNVYAAADLWVEAEETWDRLEAQLSPEQVLTVTYEELVRGPEATLQRICAFLEVDYDPCMLDFHERSTYDPITPDLADGWRRLPAQDIARVEAKLGDWLERRGYERVGDRRHVPTAAERAFLQLDHRIRKIRQRQSRYGLPLWAKASLANRLRPWVDQISLEVSRVENRYIR